MDHINLNEYSTKKPLKVSCTICNDTIREGQQLFCLIKNNEIKEIICTDCDASEKAKKYDEFEIIKGVLSIEEEPIIKINKYWNEENLI